MASAGGIGSPEARAASLSAAAASLEPPAIPAAIGIRLAIVSRSGGPSHPVAARNSRSARAARLSPSTPGQTTRSPARPRAAPPPRLAAARPPPRRRPARRRAPRASPPRVAAARQAAAITSPRLAASPLARPFERHLVGQPSRLDDRDQRVQAIGARGADEQAQVDLAGR